MSLWPLIEDKTKFVSQTELANLRFNLGLDPVQSLLAQFVNMDLRGLFRQ